MKSDLKIEKNCNIILEATSENFRYIVSSDKGMVSLRYEDDKSSDNIEIALVDVEPLCKAMLEISKNMLNE